MQRAIGWVLVAVVIGAGAFLVTRTVIDRGRPLPDDARVQTGPPPTPWPTRTPAEEEHVLQREYLAGPPWDGKGGGKRQVRYSSTQAEAEQFAAYELYWWGPAIDRFNLIAIRISYRRDSSQGDPPLDSRVDFVYGECNMEGRDQCISPSSVQVHPICWTLPSEALAGGQAAGQEETVRGGGVAVRFRHGAVLIWTGRVSVNLTLRGAPDKMDEAIQALRGFGPNGAIGPGDRKSVV